MSETPDRWPVTLSGVTEAVVSTLGPNDRWNVAALGIHAPETADDPPTARTWGRTRTWRNFSEHGEGYVQFIQDPVLYVDAALAIHETDEPILDQAHGWVRVSVEEIGSGTSGDTEFVDWALFVEESGVEHRVVPTVNRGYAAVIEATVAASRLDVEAYDSDELLDRIRYFEDVADRCGGPQEQQAFSRLLEMIDHDCDQ
ncbi:MAG: DUF447 domain-containing protein [Halovenus sp.]